jgi:threonine/homoserine/homoserine lactone efflux protein
VKLLPFLAVSAIVIITPGADMALVTRNALMHGRRAAVGTALGSNVGVFLWTVSAALGLAALVAASATALAAVKFAGALFLVYLGGKAWRESQSFAEVARGRATRPVDARMGFRQGLVSNVLNPKIALFFTGLLPQFAGTRASASDLLVLGMVFNAMGIVWLAGYGILAARARNILGRPSVKRLLDRATGVVLVGLGVRLALARNPA